MLNPPVGRRLNSKRLKTLFPSKDKKNKKYNLFKPLAVPTIFIFSQRKTIGRIFTILHFRCVGCLHPLHESLFIQGRPYVCPRILLDAHLWNWKTVCKPRSWSVQQLFAPFTQKFVVNNLVDAGNKRFRYFIFILAVLKTVKDSY